MCKTEGQRFKNYVRKVESNYYAAKRPQVWSLYPPPGRIMHTFDEDIGQKFDI